MSAAGVASNGVGYFTSGNPNAPQGTQVAFVQGAGSSFSQSINFSAGTYSLTFEAAQRGVNGGETFNVLVDGQVVGSFRPGGTSYSTFATYNFALSAGSHTIEFLGAGSAGGKGTALIDNVRLKTIPGAPLPPANLTATSNPGLSYVVLSWQDPARDETGFFVQQSSDGVHWSTIALLGSSITSYRTAKPAPGHTYFYRVLATNAAGNSGPSNVVSVSG
jgi:hypothetical protein